MSRQTSVLSHATLATDDSPQQMPTAGSVPDRFLARADGQVGVLYHPLVEESRDLGVRVVDRLTALGLEAWLESAWVEQSIHARLENLDWVVALGGDGTALRTARLLAGFNVPVLAVNFGRLGFLAELQPSAALDALPRILDGTARLEQRFMLSVEAWSKGRALGPIDALNDVFAGRGRHARAVRLATRIDGAPLDPLVADGLIIASPTGSTAYALSAGGPVLAPEMRALMLVPVAPHPPWSRALVLPGDAVVEVSMESDEDAVITVDGQTHLEVREAARLRVQASANCAWFIRLQPPAAFFAQLGERLRVPVRSSVR